MSHPFKKGDRVVPAPGEDLVRYGIPAGWVATVEAMRTARHGTHFITVRNNSGDLKEFYADRFVAYIEQPPEANSGHLPDGSSVQKHSAGPIYPCVIQLRDKRLGAGGLFDYGVLSPRNSEPVWLSNLEAAHALALVIKGDIK